jgi:hypothetical protein
MVEQADRQPERGAKPSIQPGLTGQGDLKIFDREVANVERLAERGEADDHEPVGLPRRGKEQYHAPATLRQPVPCGNRSYRNRRKTEGVEEGVGAGLDFAEGLLRSGLDSTLRSGMTSASANRWPSKATGWQ